MIIFLFNFSTCPLKFIMCSKAIYLKTLLAFIMKIYIPSNMTFKYAPKFNMFGRTRSVHLMINMMNNSLRQRSGGMLLKNIFLTQDWDSGRI